MTEILAENFPGAKTFQGSVKGQNFAVLGAKLSKKCIFLEENSYILQIFKFMERLCAPLQTYMMPTDKVT